MTALYNEIDPFAAQWLRNLIAAGHIAPGVVDERSIVDLTPDDVRGYTQCHFFAGIGVWSHALRSAGWSDDRPVWTASLPCQPFSAAGSRKGAADERNLAEVWLRLATECGPAICFGEQVEPAIGFGWLDAVFIRLEQSDYACGAAVFPACSVGAPHRRSRLYWVAESEHERHSRSLQASPAESGRRATEHGMGSPTDGVADAASKGATRGLGEQGSARDARGAESGGGGILGHASGRGLGIGGDAPQPQGREGTQRHDATAGFWRDAVWLPCRDGKARPTQSWPESLADGLADRLGFVRASQGTDGHLSPLVQGAESRVGRLRGYGNAIVGPAAAEFIRACVNAQV